MHEDIELEKALFQTAENTPPELWGRIKKEMAAKIAEELFISLETVTNPNGKEFRDKKEALIIQVYEALRKVA